LRLRDGHRFAGPCKLTGGRQARSPGTDD